MHLKRECKDTTSEAAGGGEVKSVSDTDTDGKVDERAAELIKALDSCFANKAASVSTGRQVAVRIGQRIGRFGRASQYTGCWFLAAATRFFFEPD